MKLISLPGFLSATTLTKTMLLCIALVLSGCMSGRLYHSNKDFSTRNQQHTYFNDSPVKADYLGKHNGFYTYRALDSTHREVFFRLPAEKGKEVSVDLGSHRGDKVSGGINLYFFDDGTDQHIENDRISDHPQNVYIGRHLTNDSSCIAGICQEFTYSYSCKEGSFANPLRKDFKYGLSAYDSFILGLRNTGYIATIPMDAAAFGTAAPVAIMLFPVAYMMVPTYQH